MQYDINVLELFAKRQQFVMKVTTTERWSDATVTPSHYIVVFLIS
jgi:hypothetical protein